MSLPTREELLKRFSDVEDPEILARRKRIADVLVAAASVADALA